MQLFSHWVFAYNRAEPGVLLTLQVQVVPNAEDGCIAQSCLVDIKECIADACSSQPDLACAIL